MKAVLVIDMPNGVSLDEWYAVEVIVDRLKSTEEEMMQGIPFDESKIFKFVPLRPLPKPKEANHCADEEFALLDRMYRCGFNACLDEILGETE